MVRVILERRCKRGKEGALEKLLRELRIRAMHQRGYISGETLTSIDDPSTQLVISTWTDLDAWKAWENKKERLDLVQKVGALLEEEPRIRVYAVPRL